ncbi:LysR family transcriptional regulator [Paenibacillus qinlingensis]|uniref:LysR family transcriptional regulator n=1 Tax=Paenibacillus qinlingensis TaxID=1837343 RepID=UPI00156619B3|nr:LysR family transcriptional regulator [Paenibacillus qinlingensis]NQX59960.1 LysR family transcriptional regulator [Paenibacillus qinlingensis]
MELYQLKTFIEIARTGNLTEAAAHLNTSQPAASAHIKALEKEVGFSLFFRTSKGMTITEKGSKLLLEAQKILGTLENFYLKASDLKVDSMETIRIGLNTDGQLLRIEKLIESISGCLPQVELHFIDVKSEDFTQDLTNSKINAGFYYGNVAHTAVHSIKLYSFKMVVVYPKSWDVSPKKVLNLEYFAAKPWIWTTQGCPFYKQSIDYFLQQDIVPQKIMYVDDEALIGKLVQGEIGCSLLAEPIAIQFANENMLQIWEGIDLYIDLHFGFLKDKKSDPVLFEIGSIVDRMWNEDGISI